MASGSPNTDRILRPYLASQEERIDLNKPIQENIIILVYHNSFTTKKSFEGLKDKMNDIHNVSGELHDGN